MARPRFVIPTLAVAGLAYAAYSVFSIPKVEPAPPAVQPPRAPYASTLAGTGVIEPAQARTTAIGAPFAGLVLEVFHDVGDVVKQGEPLFRLDDRALKAQSQVLAAHVKAAEAQVVVLEAGRGAAQARLDRLLAMPRPEELPPLVSRAEEAKAAVDDLQAQLSRLEGAQRQSPGVVPVDEWDRRRWSLTSAKKALERAEAELALAKAGAWAPEVAEARAGVQQADAAILQAKVAVDEAKAALEPNATEIARAVVKAPARGTVLEVNLRAGEYATANRDPLMVFADLSSLLVRTDVDEESAPLVKANPRARAVVRGFPDQPIELEFVRIEPYLRAKKSLTGATTERVDTRVLQVIFKVAKESAVPIYVGQQVDVFMEGTSRTASAAPPDPASGPAGGASGDPAAPPMEAGR